MTDRIKNYEGLDYINRVTSQCRGCPLFIENVLSSGKAGCAKLTPCAKRRDNVQDKSETTEGQ